MKFYIAVVSFFDRKCRYCLKLFSEVPVRSTGTYRHTLSPEDDSQTGLDIDGDGDCLQKLNDAFRKMLL